MTRRDYYADGRLKSVTDRGGNATRFEYDAAGHLIREINALGGAKSWTYDALGRILSDTDRGQRFSPWIACLRKRG